MPDISVVVCSHNPRPDYLQRVLAALGGQTLPQHQWELVVVDNASHERLAGRCDVSWHARARHVREDDLGLTRARFRGIAETRGELLVFVDDDNVLAPGFLEEAWAIHDQYPYLGVFGAGSLDPEFEVQPPPEIRPRMHLLALRSVTSARWSNNPQDHESIPWGAGLCVSRPVANMYRQFVEKLKITAVLGRRGHELFSGDDDVFSWAAAAVGSGFGVFPSLRVTHLIPPDRLSQPYFLRLLHDHAFTHSLLEYEFEGTRPRRIDWIRHVHLALHGIRNGSFSMRCQWAAVRGEDRAARYIDSERLQQIEWQRTVEVPRARGRLRRDQSRLFGRSSR